MDRQARGALVGGILLILVGAWFLLVQFFPDLQFFERLGFSWPVWVIGVGLLLLILGILTGSPGMAVPACIVGGIGCILYYQNATGNWTSWAYAWTLIPGFVGLGTILARLLGDPAPASWRSGFGMILTSLVLFAIFASIFGGWDLFGPYWPLLLVLLGLWILVQAFLGRKSRTS